MEIFFLQHPFKITFNPLLIGETELQLEIISQEFGTFLYELILISHPPTPEPSIRLTTTLGQTVSQSGVIKNTTGNTVNFYAQVCNY